MVRALIRHKYEERFETYFEWVKTGELKFFWGLIEIPRGYPHEEQVAMGVCKHCGKKEAALDHQPERLDRI